jgi:hypothetical protein
MSHVDGQAGYGSSKSTDVAALPRPVHRNRFDLVASNVYFPSSYGYFDFSSPITTDALFRFETTNGLVVSDRFGAGDVLRCAADGVSALIVAREYGRRPASAIEFDAGNAPVCRSAVHMFDAGHWSSLLMGQNNFMKTPRRASRRSTSVLM